MPETMINVKDAARIAAQYVADLMSQDQLKDVRLEEVELSDDGEYWLVTIGFSRPELSEFPLNAMIPRLKREYRSLKVSTKSGEVRSMKIRTP